MRRSLIHVSFISLFVIHGWLPRFLLHGIKKYLADVFNRKLHIPTTPRFSSPKDEGKETALREQKSGTGLRLDTTPPNFTAMETHNDLPNVTEVENGSLQLNGTESGESGVFLSRDNPSGLAIISFQTSRAIISTVNFYVFPCIFLLGISTNFINCVVFRRQVSGSLGCAMCGSCCGLKCLH